MDGKIKLKFTIGINDDITYTSLKYGDPIKVIDDDVKQYIF